MFVTVADFLNNANGLHTDPCCVGKLNVDCIAPFDRP